jgi:hypothetical protein
MATATHTILKYRRGNVTEMSGTLEELTEHFGYTLEAGRSYDSKVPLKPKTAKSLVSALNRATDSLQRGSFDPNFYKLKEA